MNVPSIIQDDAEKVTAFLEGAGEDQGAAWGKIMRKYRLNDPLHFACEAERRKLSARARSIVNCWKWGFAIKHPPERVDHGAHERERTGVQDVYDYMLHRQSGRYMPWFSWPDE